METNELQELINELVKVNMTDQARKWAELLIKHAYLTGRIDGLKTALELRGEQHAKQ